VNGLAERPLFCGVAGQGNAGALKAACLLNEVDNVHRHDRGLRRTATGEADCPVLKPHGVYNLGEIRAGVAYLHGVGNQFHEDIVTDSRFGLLVQDARMYSSVMSNDATTAGNEHYDTWIANLLNGRQSDEDQAARAKFRAMQAAPVAPRPVTARPAGVAATGTNTWAVSDRSDGLAHYTLIGGPGRFANCAGQ
jgi:hypothetical protein